MDLYSILSPVFLKFWWLSIIVLAILILKSPVGKGWIGELIVRSRISAEEYLEIKYLTLAGMQVVIFGKYREKDGMSFVTSC